MHQFIPSEEVKNRQQNLLTTLSSGQAVLILANQIFYKNGDTEFCFRQDSNFWYFTGFDEDDAAILFVDGQLSLFAKEKNPTTETCTGKILGLTEAQKLVKADEVYPFSKLAEIVETKTKNLNRIYFDSTGNSYAILRQELENIFEKNQIEIQNESKATAKLRIFKSKWEIEQIQKACDIAVLAHQRVGSFFNDYKLNSIVLGGRFPFETGLQTLSENHLQAILNYTYNEFKTMPSYSPIVASGSNSTTLHYWQNNRDFREQDLVLIDSGCEYNYYASDITRVYSLDGFSLPQQQIYDSVLKANTEIIELAKTHISRTLTLEDLQQKTIQILTQGLIDLHILGGSLEENIENKTYQKYYMHGVSHWLGLDTHDQGFYKKNGHSISLKPNMVFTVEPGLYFEYGDSAIPSRYWGIGIRIEDNILLTETGIANLTEKLKK